MANLTLAYKVRTYSSGTLGRAICNARTHHFVADDAGGDDAGGGVTLYPVVAPALILVGVMMVRGVRRIDWDDPTEALPAFLTLMVMPLAVSITDGIAFGFIAYALLKLATGRGGEVHWLVHLFAALFLARYAVLV